MARLNALLVLSAYLCLFASVRGEHKQGICNLSFCSCRPDTHPSWTTINCTTTDHQKLDIFEGDLPESTTNLIISGPEAVMFGINSLSRLRNPQHISIKNSNAIILRRGAGANLNDVSMYLEVENCDLLRVEERTFSNIKGPLSVSIRNCEVVSVEGQAFSWLLEMSIKNVKQLQLGRGAFTLDPTSANVGEHGPGMSIELANTSIPEIPTQTFGSSAARVLLESVEVNTLRYGAFSANTYNIVIAVNCSFYTIENEAFSQKSLIENLSFNGCRIHQLASRALQSAVTKMKILKSRFENINTGAFNNTMVSVVILDSTFKKFSERGFELGSITKLQMERNSFDDLAANAIVAPGASIHELIFIENEIETIHSDSLGFIGQAETSAAHNIIYKNNYFGHTCYCNFTQELAKAFAISSAQFYENESYCTVNEFFARCFNEHTQNMLLKKFYEGVCTEKPTIQCERFQIQSDGDIPKIKNNRFPHKSEEESGLSDRNKKVIGIILVSVFSFIILAMLFSLIRWMRRRGYCICFKNLLLPSNYSLCERLCSCGSGGGHDNARSISQMSVNEYSERLCLNESRIHEVPQETQINETQIVPMDDKSIQTLPEELSKELLENLKARLDSPENYTEAREMIEHLYELTKMEETNRYIMPQLLTPNENIYDLPFQETAPRLGRNNVPMINVGTRAPSLERLMPLSPYNRQTALAHEYFEPKDLAIHLYDEIANDRGKRNPLGVMPDLVGEQPMPRGPYLSAVREKNNSGGTPAPTADKSWNNFGSPLSISSIKSNKSNGSSKMMNRPLPEKPVNADPGEGTSSAHG